MTILDIVLAIPILFLVFKGWKKGLVREVATLTGLLAGIWATVHLSQQVAVWLGLESENAVLIAFLVTFVGVLVLTYLLGQCIEGLMKAAKMGLLNHLAGAALGAVKALCILAVLLNYVVMLDKHEKLLTPEAKESSKLYTPVYSIGNRMTDSLKQYIAEHKEEWQEALKK